MSKYYILMISSFSVLFFYSIFDFTFFNIFKHYSTTKWYLTLFNIFKHAGIASSFGRVTHFQMLAVMVLSQHHVSTSKTVSPRIPVGGRCTGHVRMMCSAVCSAVPHLQINVGARPRLCMNN